MKVTWKDADVNTKLFFGDLPLNATFRIKGAKGAVYVKTIIRNLNITTRNQYMMYEIASGALFDPTKSEVELVDVEVKVNVPKPSVY